MRSRNSSHIPAEPGPTNESWSLGGSTWAQILRKVVSQASGGGICGVSGAPCPLSCCGPPPSALSSPAARRARSWGRGQSPRRHQRGRAHRADRPCRSTRIPLPSLLTQQAVHVKELSRPSSREIQIRVHISVNPNQRDKLFHPAFHVTASFRPRLPSKSTLAHTFTPGAVSTLQGMTTRNGWAKFFS